MSPDQTAPLLAAGSAVVALLLLAAAYALHRARLERDACAGCGLLSDHPADCPALELGTPTPPTEWIDR